MIRALLFCFVFSFLSFKAASQQPTEFKASEIRAEQDNEKINILYKIPQSTSDDLFRIILTAEINGNPAGPVRSVTGDVGEQIRGGKLQYKISWDALKDYNKIETAAFFIDVQKIKPSAPASTVNKPTPPKQSDELYGNNSQKYSKPVPKSSTDFRKRKWLLAFSTVSDIDEGYTAPGVFAAFYKTWGGYVNINNYELSGGIIYRVVVT